MKIIYFYLRTRNVFVGVGIFVVVIFVFLAIVMAFYVKSKFINLLWHKQMERKVIVYSQCLVNIQKDVTRAKRHQYLEKKKTN